MSEKNHPAPRLTILPGGRVPSPDEAPKRSDLGAEWDDFIEQSERERDQRIAQRKTRKPCPKPS